MVSNPTLKGFSIIGSGTGSGGNGQLQAVNPATGDALEPAYALETESGLAKAMQLAEEAFETYGQTSGQQRAEFLRTIAAGLEAAADDIAARMGLETALPEGRCRGELGRTCGQLRMFAGIVEQGDWVDARIEPAQPDRTPVPRPDTRSMLRPLGPVVVFGASNFPLAFSTAGGDTASALAAGCPVVVKAHPAHPGTAELVAKVIQDSVKQCGLAEGVFSLVYGAGNEAGAFLVTHPSTKAVGFTGSRSGGRALMDLAAGRAVPIPVYAEMSAINPVFITPGAIAENKDALVAGYLNSVTLGVGQFCTNPGITFVTQDAAEDFLAAVAEKVTQTSAASMLTTGICDAYNQGVQTLSSQSGVQTVGQGTAAQTGQAQPNVFRCDLETFLSNPTLHQEVFGPAGLIVTCPAVDDYATVAGKIEGQLTATIHATESEIESGSLNALAQTLSAVAGRLVFNGFPTGVEVGTAMVHGGPYPATSDGRSTSVGATAIVRFARPVCWQDFPAALLPAELQDDNPLGIKRSTNDR